MNARTQALIWDFALWSAAGFVLAAAPILQSTMQAGPDRFDGRLFLWALGTAAVTGVIGAARKLLAPQLVSIAAGDMPGDKPTVVGVALKDVNPAPVKIDQLQQQRPRSTRSTPWEPTG